MKRGPLATLRAEVERKDKEIEKLRAKGLPVEIPEGVRAVHIVVEDSEIAMMSHGASKVTVTDQDANELRIGAWHDMPHPADAARARHLVIPLSRTEAVDGIEPDLLVDANERAEEARNDAVEERTKRVQAEDRAERANEAAKMLERQREEVQGKREEAEADLVEEQRIHRQDVEELKRWVARGKRAEEALEVERARSQIAAEFAEGQLETITGRAERAEESLRKVSELVAGGEVEGEIGGEIQDEISKTLKRAGSYPPPAIIDLGEITQPFAFGNREGFFRGIPTEHGMRFERVEGTEGLVLDHFTTQKRDEREVAELREKLEAAEKRNVEVTAYAEAMCGQIREFTEALLGDEPPWWVTAAGALAELQKLEAHDAPLKGSFARGGVVPEVTIVLHGEPLTTRTAEEHREDEREREAAERRERGEA